MARALLLILLVCAAPTVWSQEPASDIETLRFEAARLRAEIDKLKQVEGQAGEESPLLTTRLRRNVFHWRTEDGNFSFSQKVAVIARWVGHDTLAQSGEGPTADNGRDFMNFRVPTVRVFYTGNIFGREWQYAVWWTPFLDASNQMRLEDVWIRWAPIPEFNIRVGQMKSPASWEHLVDVENYAFTESSIADKAFHQDWVKGIEVQGALDLWATRVFQYEAGIYNGRLSTADGQGAGALNVVGGRSRGVAVTNTGKTENYLGGFRNNDWRLLNDQFSQIVDADLMPAIRLEFHPLGQIPRHMADFRSEDEWKDWGFFIGAAFSWFAARVNGQGTFLGNVYRPNPFGATGGAPGTGRFPFAASIQNYTVDGHFRGFGLAVNWAIYYRVVEFSNFGRAQGTNTIDAYIPTGVQDLGWSVEVSWFPLAKQLLLMARWSHVDFDEFGSRTLGGAPVDGDSFGADGDEYGGGVAYMIAGDHLKITADYRYVVQQLPHGVGRDGSTLNAIERVSEYRNFWELRVQLQWIF